MAAKKKGSTPATYPLIYPVPLEEAHTDPVNHPSHYQGKVECIDALESCLEGMTGFESFCTGNAMKYLWRWKRKGYELDDLSKAAWYIERLKKHVTERNG